MSYETERADIATYLDANCSLKTKYPNRKFKQPVDEIWLKFSIVHAETIAESFGDVQDFEFSGRIVLSLFAPIDSGTKEINDQADLLVNLFINKTIGGVMTYSPEIGLSEKSGNWYQVTLTIPFTRDEIFTI